MMKNPIPTNSVDAYLAMVSSYPDPAQKLAALHALGMPLDLLIKASIWLHEDPCDALLAVPVPLPMVLAQIPPKVAEQALLGFTVASVLETIGAQGPPALVTGQWARIPKTLHELHRLEHPKILQVLYLGTLITWPSDPARWARAARIMTALAHPLAESPEYAPVTPTISALYDSSPNHLHPYLFFAKQTIHR